MAALRDQRCPRCRDGPSSARGELDAPPGSRGRGDAQRQRVPPAFRPGECRPDHLGDAVDRPERQGRAADAGLHVCADGPQVPGQCVARYDQAEPERARHPRGGRRVSVRRCARFHLPEPPDAPGSGTGRPDVDLGQSDGNGNGRHQPLHPSSDQFRQHVQRSKRQQLHDAPVVQPIGQHQPVRQLHQSVHCRLQRSPRHGRRIQRELSQRIQPVFQQSRSQPASGARAPDHAFRSRNLDLPDRWLRIERHRRRELRRTGLRGRRVLEPHATHELFRAGGEALLRYRIQRDVQSPHEGDHLEPSCLERRAAIRSPRDRLQHGGNQGSHRQPVRFDHSGPHCSANRR